MHDRGRSDSSGVPRGSRRCCGSIGCSLRPKRLQMALIRMVDTRVKFFQDSVHAVRGTRLGGTLIDTLAVLLSLIVSPVRDSLYSI